MQIIIREETPQDVSEIYKINEIAFGQPNEAKLVDKLRQSDAWIPGLSLVAQIGDQVVGHILFTRIQIKDGDASHESLALAPMAVLPTHQLQGVGGALIKEGTRKARQLGFQSIVVVGHANYYPKYGFAPAANWHIDTHYKVPSEAFMALALQPNGLNNVRGTVVYPAAFDEV
ncbi:putative acetyltransferase [Chitinophaga skermanii]|uniref:Putative acetyltransferase n=1 Tax=Chitinophaga skermanii TaxID=331697 RepID=A0A327QQE7_9BACT|nr:N-acetyltransferase [Chitinophaga skermanii]RAJ06570.1 putative acetyltransferase [Chitinophaga skermanii]